MARLLTLLAVLLTLTASAARGADPPVWSQVGASVAAGDAISTRMAAVANVPWIVVARNGGQLAAARWDGAAWQPTPALPVAAGHQASGGAIADVGGVPYVSWSDYNAGAIKVRVARWTGTAWESVGGDLNPNLGSSAAIAGVDGVPYVALQDAVDGTGHSDLVVRRWSGTAWEAVGAALNVDGENVLDLSIADVGDEPVVAWSQEGTRRKVYVARFDGTAWVKLGGELNHAGQDAARAPSVTALGGAPGVAWLEQSATTGFVTRVARWTGTAWADMGGAVTQTGSTSPPSLAQIAGVPWLATVDGEDQIAVARWDGSDWQGTIPRLRRSNDGFAGTPSLVSFAGVPFVSWFEAHGTPTGQFDVYAAQYGDAVLPAQLHFSSAARTVDEGDGTATLTVERTGGTAGTVSAHFATANGTASTPADFGGGAGTVTFAPGETAQALSVPIVDDGTHEPDETFTVTLSAPSAGAQLDAPSITTVTIADDDPIDTLIDSGPSGYLTDQRFRFFVFHADPAAGATFTCAVDQAAAAPCTNPFDPGVLPEGRHTVRIRAGAGPVQDATPATREFVVDTVRPQTSVTVAGTLLPSGRYRDAVTVSAAATDPAPGSGVAEVRCVVDPGTEPQTASELRAPCPAIVSTPGPHVVYAAAVDRAGNAGIPAKTAFTVSAGPNTLITAGPDGDVYGGPQLFWFISSPMGAPRYECRVDGGAPTPCNSGAFTTDALGAGTHVFSVAAIDSDGVTDPTPATRTYRVRPAATTTRECDVMLPRQKDAIGYSSAALYPYTVNHFAGYERRGCNAEFGPCPAGALCTVSARVKLHIADNTHLDYFAEPPRPDFIIRWVANANVKVDNLLRSRGCDIHNSRGSAECVGETATAQISGPSDKLVASCAAAPDSYSGSGDSAWGPDDERRLHCDITLKTEPIKPFAVTSSGTRVTVYAPGPGALTLAAGGRGLRSTTAAAAKRAPLFKTVRKQVTAAGPVAFRLTLSKAARRLLARRHRLVLTLRQTFVPTGGSAVRRSTRVTVLAPVKRVTGRQFLRARCRSKALRRSPACRSL